MRAYGPDKSRRVSLAAALAILLCCSPASALRMLLTVCLTPVYTTVGPVVGARLKLQRKTAPLPIDVTRPLVIRKGDAERPVLPPDRSSRTESGLLPRLPIVRRAPLSAELRQPAFLLSYLSSGPPQRVGPPSDPDASAS